MPIGVDYYVIQGKLTGALYLVNLPTHYSRHAWVYPPAQWEVSYFVATGSLIHQAGGGYRIGPGPAWLLKVLARMLVWRMEIRVHLQRRRALSRSRAVAREKNLR